MNLVDLMQDLVENPEKLAEYKQDPTAYLERAGIQPADAHIAPLHTEVTTVLSMGIFKPGWRSATGASLTALEGGDAKINLEGTPIKIVPLEATFLAESDTIIQSQLLPHSYISITDTEKAFDLHLLYVSGPDDDPQVLYIKTIDQLLNPTYNFSNAHVILQIQGYILASKSNPISTTLGPDCYFDPVTNTLFLDINVPPQGPGENAV